MNELKEIKATIRSVLLSLGKTATEKEIRNAWREQEGYDFDGVLKKFRLSFFEFLYSMSDVVKVSYAYNQYFYQRVSTNESRHMDSLTINKYNKSYKGPKILTKNGDIKSRPGQPLLNARALPYSTKFKHYNSRPPPSQQSWRNHTFNSSVQYGPRHPIDINTSINQSLQQNTYQFPKRTITLESTRINHSPLNHSNNVQKRILGSSVPVEKDLHKAEAKMNLTKDFIPVNHIKDTKSLTHFVKIDKKPVETDKKLQKSEKNETLKTCENPQVRKIENNQSLVTTKVESNEQVTDNLVKQDQITENITDLLDRFRLEESKSEKIISENETVNPLFLKNRLRSMRIFREALKQLNENEQNNSSSEVFTFVSKIVVELPEPIQNELVPFFEIKILDVLSSSHFTFQFSFEKLKALTTNMNQFYGNLKDIEKFRAHELIEESIVAFRRGPSSWCRAQIKSFQSSTAEVQYIDFQKIGTDMVSTNNLYELHQKFTTESPKSAIGKLHGINTRKFCDISSASKLIDLIDKKVLATVTNVENDVYSLSIYIDTDKLLRISDVLIEEKLAEIDTESLMKNTVLRSLM